MLSASETSLEVAGRSACTCRIMELRSCEPSLVVGGFDGETFVDPLLVLGVVGVEFPSLDVFVMDFSFSVA